MVSNRGAAPVGKLKMVASCSWSVYFCHVQRRVAFNTAVATGGRPGPVLVCDTTQPPPPKF